MNICWGKQNFDGGVYQGRFFQVRRMSKFLTSGGLPPSPQWGKPCNNLKKSKNTNKFSLNVKKTEMVIFKSKQKKFEGDFKIKLCKSY